MYAAAREGKYADAEQYGQHAEVWVERAADETTQLKFLYDRGGALNMAGQWDKALVEHQRALRLAEHLADQERIADVLGGIAADYDLMGKHDEAEEFYQRALRLDEDLLGPKHPDVATLLTNRGLMLADEEKFAAARPLLERALQIDLDAAGETRHIVPTLIGLAATYGWNSPQLSRQEREENYKRGMELSQRALRIQEKLLGPEHRDLVASLVQIGQFALDAHHPTEALAPLNRALAVAEKGHALPVDIALAQSLVAMALADSGGDLRRARRLMTLARDEFARSHREKWADESDAWLAKHR
jgi:tetratricopeptide (TPR) repeat protein